MTDLVGGTSRRVDFLKNLSESNANTTNKKTDSRRSSAKWTAELVDQIFCLTHLQWTYRNNYIHYRVSDGAETVDEYKARMARISKTLELTNPEELLEEDRQKTI